MAINSTTGNATAPNPSNNLFDAFGRQRVGNPTNIFNHKNTFGSGDGVDFFSLTEGGGSVNHSVNKSAVELSVGTTAGDRAVRQSQYSPYVPGKSQRILITGYFGESQDGTVYESGYFDSLNGIFLRESNGVVSFVIRSDKTGTVEENEIPQDQWNLDKLDGNGISGITLDVTKNRIQDFDLQWLGTGSVRFGFNIDGRTVYAHVEEHANATQDVYMRNPNLPIRHEIRNTKTVASGRTMTEICCAIDSEGGDALTGTEYSAGNNITALRGTSTTRTPIAAFRLKQYVPNTVDIPNRITPQLLDINAIALTEVTQIDLEHAHAGLSTDGTWVSVSDESAMEYNTTLTSVTGTAEQHLINTLFVSAGGGGNKAQPSTSGGNIIVNNHAKIHRTIDNSESQMWIIYAQTNTGTGTAGAHINWIE